VYPMCKAGEALHVYNGGYCGVFGTQSFLQTIKNGREAHGL
jgi:hypothetical protein